MDRIKSFEVDHRLLHPGIYLSRKDGEYCTYDLRVKKPNSGDYMDNITMHSVEHMMATFLRNSLYKDKILYFGPMGCRTGFYLIAHESVKSTDILSLVKRCLVDTVMHEGDVFGNSEQECGNFKELDIFAAKKLCASYYVILEDIRDIQQYPE